MGTFDRLVIGLLWAALLGYALLLSPPGAGWGAAINQSIAMLTLDFGRVDAIAAAIFNLLGIIPLAFMALILFDRGRPNPWPFAIGGLAFGGFLLLPYLLLRDDRPRRHAEPNAVARIIGSRPAGALMLAGATVLLAIAVIAGDAARFLEQTAQSKLFAVMTADFVALTIALHLTAAADRRHRGIALGRGLSIAVHLPLLGPLLDLAVRRKS